ncbi:MAG TPA: hypothetical protein VGH14_00370 [Solirubrobacterales bacterium]
MNFPQLRPASPNGFLTCLATFMVLLVVGLAVTARPADAAVSGVQEAWEVEVGTDPGQFFNPASLGVDPVDGSVFVLDEEPGGTGFRVDKFTATGEFKGSTGVLSATATEPGAVEGRAFVGIAVDHALGEFYLVQSEPGLDATKSTLAVATKILPFSTEPQSEVLAAKPPLPLPAANEPAATLLAPNEIHVDPADGDLVISAVNEAGQAVLQTITSAGLAAGRYEETGSSLFVRQKRRLNFGFDIGADGTTYLVANSGELAEHEALIDAFSLPPGFGSSSTLTPLPGFQAAGAADEWGSNPWAVYRNDAVIRGDVPGPQAAIGIASDGEETLYWKSAKENSAHESIRIHGWSLQQQATTVGFGGGVLGASCSIESLEAVLAATKNGNLVVLGQGESLANASQFPTWEPQVLRFGPSSENGARSSVCPDPAPKINLKAGDSTVTGSVVPGTTVTLDASESDMGGFTPSELVWTVSKAGGSPESFPVTPPSFELAHQFAGEGEYTIQLQLAVSEEVQTIGSRFNAKPRKLTVSAGPTTHALTVTKTGTGTGTVTCKIDGGTAAACPTTVDDGAEVEVIVAPDSGSELGAVSGTGSGSTCTTAPCHFTAGADSTVSVELKSKTTVGKHKLTITNGGSGSGKILCNGGNCAAEYAVGSEVTLAAVADSGSTFDGWTDGGGCSGTGSCKVVIGANDVSVTATFSLVPPPDKGNTNPPSTNPSPLPSPIPKPTPPSNSAKPGAVKLSGSTASVTVTVPGAGKLVASGKGVVAVTANAKGAGPVQLKLKLTGTEKKTLAKKGKVTVKVTIVFTPTGGSAGTTTKTITFKAKKAH